MRARRRQRDRAGRTACASAWDARAGGAGGAAWGNRARPVPCEVDALLRRAQREARARSWRWPTGQAVTSCCAVSGVHAPGSRAATARGHSSCRMALVTPGCLRRRSPAPCRPGRACCVVCEPRSEWRVVSSYKYYCESAPAVGMSWRRPCGLRVPPPPQPPRLLAALASSPAPGCTPGLKRAPRAASAAPRGCCERDDANTCTVPERRCRLLGLGCAPCATHPAGEVVPLGRLTPKSAAKAPLGRVAR